MFFVSADWIYRV